MPPIDTEWVRVLQKDTGHELTISRSMYDFAPRSYDLLKDEDATDSGNNPLPPTYAAAKKTAAAGSQKESK